MSNINEFIIANNFLKKDLGSSNSVVIPDSVIAIGAGAFRGCESLTSITMPDGVKTIGYSAFYYCNKLTVYAVAGSYAE